MRFADLRIYDRGPVSPNADSLRRSNEFQAQTAVLQHHQARGLSRKKMAVSAKPNCVQHFPKSAKIMEPNYQRQVTVPKGAMPLSGA
jgi:hypothetical protein